MRGRLFDLGAVARAAGFALVAVALYHFDLWRREAHPALVTVY